MTTNTGTLPIDNAARIVSLDVIRGIALLGILIMNIQSFSMPGSAYLNPTAYGDLNGANFITWLVSHLFADTKFMSIFSMLFGAGILVFCQRAEQKEANATALHYRRNFWLLIFGLVHAHFIWYGDILFPYAMCAFVVFWFRNFSVKKLLWTSFIFLFIGSGYNLFIGFSMPYIPSEAIDSIMQSWRPDQAHLEKEIAAYQGNVFEQFAFRHPEATFMQTQVFMTMFLWRIIGMMCLGMALFKSDILTAKRPASYYRKLILICLPLGLFIIGWGAYENIQHEFKMQFSFFLGSQFNFWGSIFLAVSYIGLICLWLSSNSMQNLKQRLANVGKMAFTNYIFHSLVFTFIFYGHGLGLFGEVERSITLVMVVSMWIFQLWFSSFWLKRFLFGPLEWAWRCLTYWQLQPLKKTLSAN